MIQLHEHWVCTAVVHRQLPPVRRRSRGAWGTQCAWPRSSLPSISLPPSHNSLHPLVLLPATTTAASLPDPFSGLSGAPVLFSNGSPPEQGCSLVVPHAPRLQHQELCVSQTPTPHLAVSAHQGSPSFPAQLPRTCTLPWSCPVQRSWGLAYMMEQVKPQHSLSRVRPVFVMYGAEVCCPLEVIFFSLTGATERGINVCLVTRAKAHRFFSELLSGLIC